MMIHMYRDVRYCLKTKKEMENVFHAVGNEVRTTHIFILFACIRQESSA